MFLIFFLVSICSTAPATDEAQKHEDCGIIDSIKVAICMGKTLYTNPGKDEAKRLNITEASEEVVICKRTLSCLEEYPCAKDNETEFLQGRCGLIDYLYSDEFEKCEIKIGESNPKFQEDLDAHLETHLLDKSFAPGNCPNWLKSVSEMRAEIVKNCEKNVWKIYYEHVRKLNSKSKCDISTLG